MGPEEEKDIEERKSEGRDGLMILTLFPPWSGWEKRELNCGPENNRYSLDKEN